MLWESYPERDGLPSVVHKLRSPFTCLAQVPQDQGAWLGEVEDKKGSGRVNLLNRPHHTL